MDIQPGSTIKLELTRRPTREAAEKTLTRLFMKDAGRKKAKEMRQRHRPSWQEWRRGGMTWHHQMKSQSPVDLSPGATYTIRGSVDVIRDLGSVAEFVKVSQA